MKTNDTFEIGVALHNFFYSNGTVYQRLAYSTLNLRIGRSHPIWKLRLTEEEQRGWADITYTPVILNDKFIK